MRIIIQTPEYDKTALTKPFATVASWTPHGVDVKPTRWAIYFGQLGEAGELHLTANPGDVVMVGQSSRNGGEHPPRRYYRVNQKGKLEAFPTKARAIVYYLKNNWNGGAQ